MELSPKGKALLDRLIGAKNLDPDSQRALARVYLDRLLQAKIIQVCREYPHLNPGYLQAVVNGHFGFPRAFQLFYPWNRNAVFHTQSDEWMRQYRFDDFVACISDFDDAGMEELRFYT
jgi:hypothetical protein